jgi:hypothetical protein
VARSVKHENVDVGDRFTHCSEPSAADGAAHRINHNDDVWLFDVVSDGSTCASG